MAFQKLLWVGLICCLTALAVQLFPHAAFQLGVNVEASWRVFGFGVFLIVVSGLFASLPRHH